VNYASQEKGCQEESRQKAEEDLLLYSLWNRGYSLQGGDGSDQAYVLWSPNEAESRTEKSLLIFATGLEDFTSPAPVHA